MSAITENQPKEEVRVDTTEQNLAKQRQMYERKLEQERQARQQAEERAVAAERAAQERSKMSPLNEDDDDDSEPYVDKVEYEYSFNYGMVDDKTQADIEETPQGSLNYFTKQITKITDLLPVPA